MKRIMLGGMESGTPEEFKYKGFAEQDKDNIPEGEYTEEELRHMADEVEKNKVSFSSIDFSQYSKVSH